MAQYRKDRLASEIVKETSKILLHDMMDPRKGFMTVTRAKVSSDYKYARIFVSVMGSPRQKKKTMAGLKHAVGFIQMKLSRAIRMRAFPEIVFELDESIEKAFKVNNILAELAREREARNPERGDEADPATTPTTTAEEAAEKPAEEQGEEE